MLSKKRCIFFRLPEILACCHVSVVDLLIERFIDGFATQGHYDRSVYHWVTGYLVHYSIDGLSWDVIGNGEAERVRSVRLGSFRDKESQKVHQVPALICGFCIMRRLGVVLLPLDGILVHRRLPSSIFSGCPQAICWFLFIHLSGWRDALRE